MPLLSRLARQRRIASAQLVDMTPKWTTRAARAIRNAGTFIRKTASWETKIMDWRNKTQYQDCYGGKRGSLAECC
eukprot:8511179-Lingulodinium_polyedra.AAC.1